MQSFEGNHLAQWHKICSQETRDSTLANAENFGSVQGQNTRTDRQTELRQLRAVECKNRD